MSPRQNWVIIIYEHLSRSKMFREAPGIDNPCSKARSVKTYLGKGYPLPLQAMPVWTWKYQFPLICSLNVIPQLWRPEGDDNKGGDEVEVGSEVRVPRCVLEIMCPAGSDWFLPQLFTLLPPSLDVVLGSSTSPVQFMWQLTIISANHMKW